MMQTDQALDAIIFDLADRQVSHGETRDQRLFLRHEKERNQVGNARILVVKSITPRFHLTSPILWTAHCQTPLEFTFMDLPSELRDKIWAYATLEGRIIKLFGKKVLSDENHGHGLNPYESNLKMRWARAGIPTQKDRDVPEELAETELRSLETTRHWDEAFQVLQEKVNTIKSNTAKDRKVNPRKIPSVLSVNKASRNIALQHYSLILGPQRDGKPIFFNFAVDALYVQDDWDLLVLCGIDFPESTNNLCTSILPNMFPSQRNEIEQNLRFLVIDDSLEPTTIAGLARFRSLERLLVKPKKEHSTRNLFTQIFLGYDSRPAEHALKEAWRLDDEDWGEDAKPNSVPQFLYFKITRNSMLRDENAIS
ncbi:hypothetical protein ONS95_010073 [Cadophora gregata]|uniref:uncharacterized protein n=1 Tax=Cadophora gregata TaxID=51156 RepID=UPI0026DCC0B5|nr:uncharacterized protein ONS95_010073 [Cadophora gregata]KAK0121790.1 hypothetical protein ONS95_010073 [Cadophora gregata]